MIALIFAAALAAQAPPVVETCAVVAAPRDYVGRKFTIRTTLGLTRHGSLLNFPRGDCQPIHYQTLEDSQARQALVQIDEVMFGRDYWRRFKTKAPRISLSLDLKVTVTGTMFCPTAKWPCVMQVTGLEEVVYPANFPREMVPPGSGWAGP